MSKPAKPAAAADGAAPKKSKKMLIIIIAAVVVLLAGGAAAFVLMKPVHPPKHGEETGAAAEESHAEDSHAEVEPKYVELGTFTANLIHEEGDRYLQVAISLKLTKPELEEKIKARSPEILHKVNMLLQSRTPSELATLQGKEKLADDIKGQVQYILGLRKTDPIIVASLPIGQNSDSVASDVPSVAVHAPAATHGKEPVAEIKPGVAEVLFTSFIIQ
jgi:flagellar FliL protein